MKDLHLKHIEACSNWSDAERESRRLYKQLGCAIIQRCEDPAWSIGAIHNMIEKNEELALAELYRLEKNGLPVKDN